MSTTNNTYEIEPPNGENYVTWHRHLEWILNDLDLWAVTNGETKELEPVDPRHPTAQECQVRAEWVKKDRKAKQEIGLWISDEYLVYIDETMTALELWTRLQGIFESKATVGVINIQREFFWMFAEDSANMEEHI